MKEAEIRPKEIFNKYLELSMSDGKKMFEQAEKFVDVACPACQARLIDEQFIKNGFSIKRCKNCDSLYCSPRPAQEQLNELYANSLSCKYWVKDFLPCVMDARIEKMYRPKAKIIFEMFRDIDFSPHNVVDIGAGTGLLLNELKALWKDSVFFAIEPGRSAAEVCRANGYETLEMTVESAQAWHGKIDLAICLEVIEHVFDVKDFVTSLFRLVRPGGYCLVTGLGGDGFDIQVLKEKSKSIFPPHHLNFLSVKGVKQLFHDCGFEPVQVTTPGQLDVDIVLNAIKDNEVEVPAFFKILFERSLSAQADFQDFLVKHQLSSHMWILARRPESDCRVNRRQG